MSSICVALNRPLREAHPEETIALAAKADLLVAGVAFDGYARVMVENGGKVCEASPWAADTRAAEIVRPAPVQAADGVPPKSLVGTWRLQSYNGGFCQLRRRCMLRSYTAICFQSNRPSCSVREDLALARAGQNWHRMRNGGWQRRCDSARHQMQARAPGVLCGKEMMGTCASNVWQRTRSTRFAASSGSQGQTTPRGPVHLSQTY